MKTMRTAALVLIVSVTPLWAGPFDGNGPPPGVPYIGGIWYLNGDFNSPCEIRQRRPDGNAEFINENGSRAWGSIRGNRVWIPEWTDGRRQGLSGVIWEDRIVWPNGSFWSR